MTNNNSFVSVVIPCRNEEKFIGKCLDSILANDYPKDRLELLVVDGGSEDRTREIVGEFTKKFSFIKLVDNPRKITPCAFNIGIKDSQGEIIIIMGAHATFEKDYISKCVKYLDEYKADNVGGTMITLPRENTLVGKAIVCSLSSPFGVGNSRFRTGSKKPIWVDTVFGGCYRKELFDKIGLFNEELINSQDMEFNLRLKKAGGKTLLVPDVISYYYTRSDFRSFCKNNFRNGIWAIYPLKFIKYLLLSPRHMVPLTFISSLILSGILALFWSTFLWLFSLISSLYLAVNLYFSIKIAIREKKLRYIVVLPLIFATLHLFYGFGSLIGLFKVVFSKSFWKNKLRLKTFQQKEGKIEATV